MEKQDSTPMWLLKARKRIVMVEKQVIDRDTYRKIKKMSREEQREAANQIEETIRKALD